jgi:serine/threonine protein kinase
MAQGTLAGQTVAHYHVLSELGRGGMGVVYRAEDPRLGRQVALKFLPDGLAKNRQALQRFRREARTASALNHPNICTIYDIGQHHGEPFIVMELLEGRTLREHLGGQPLPVDHVLELGLQLADALDVAHAKGILHRDIKSANIFVTDRGQAKILDFGLARLTRDQPLPADGRTVPQHSVTNPGEPLGTIAYMSPEQARGEPLDPRSDLFSAGVVLYEMATGRLPFDGGTSAVVYDAILHRTPTAPHALNPNVPAELEAMIARALAKAPADRYQHARELHADLRRLARGDSSRSAPRASGLGLPASGPAARNIAPRSRRKLAYAALVAAGIVAVVAAAPIWLRSDTKPADRSEWAQLTSFPDSVTQPALSPDGRVVAFIRGSGSFVTTGQIFVKILPEGEPKQLTQDNASKMSPVFSPDGSQIAYTVRIDNNYDTWVVPLLGGEPRRWLPNASGLAWFGNRQLVFSEIIRKTQGNHMKIVAAGESRAGQRDVYVPMPSGAMAHRSFPSPDGRWALVSEMTDRGLWMPCRAVPIDGSSTGQPVGPPGAPCWFGAWSPDGKWIYVNSAAGGTFHIWRQRFAENGTLGEPEQVTSGPTEEQGLTMAPDGRSFITAVGFSQSAVWLHDANGDRQISLEGYSTRPRFTRDGKQLLYARSVTPDSSELWIADLDAGRTEPLLRGFPIVESAFDISPDGREIVAEALDAAGKHRLWLAPIDRHSAPRQIPGVEGDGPLFAPNGDVVFRSREGSYGFAYSVHPDGNGLHKVLEFPVINTLGISPDGKWLIVYSRPTEGETGATVALPLGGGLPVRLLTGSKTLIWSGDGRALTVSSAGLTLYSSRGLRSSYIVPLPPGRVLPEVPPSGLSDTDLAAIPGARVIDVPEIAVGPNADVYAFARETVQRNLYRIPVK